jgi:hypothetical protein
MQLAATRSRVGSGVGDLEAISEAMFTSTRVLASRHVGDSLQGRLLSLDDGGPHGQTTDK